METYGASGRVLRYAHNFGKCYGVPAGSVALCSPSSCCAARRRSANCGPIASGSTASTTRRPVENYLEELATRTAGALVLKLSKQPERARTPLGTSVCGAVIVAESAVRPNVGGGDNAALEERLTRLEQEVADLRVEATVGCWDC